MKQKAILQFMGKVKSSVYRLRTDKEVREPLLVSPASSTKAIDWSMVPSSPALMEETNGSSPVEYSHPSDQDSYSQYYSRTLVSGNELSTSVLKGIM